MTGTHGIIRDACGHLVAYGSQSFMQRIIAARGAGFTLVESVTSAQLATLDADCEHKR